MERQRDAERTRAEILDAATSEFAEHGYSGARVDVIAERTRTTKRMLYYYFESKAGLYTAVLERAYGEIRERERRLDVEGLDPVAAIRRLAELTFDHHESHPDFIRLVSIENIHRAEHLAGSKALADDAHAGDRHHGADPRARVRRGRLPARRRRDRRAHDDQRVLRLPRGQPAHVRDDLRARPDVGRRCARATGRCSATWSSTTCAPARAEAAR